MSHERASGVPRHVACIMDGNGRWATRRGLPRVDGHAAGEEAITATVDAAMEHGIRWLTLYAFSTENWDRPRTEVDFLMHFNWRLIEKLGDDYHRRGIRIRYMGHRADPVPRYVQSAMTEIQDRTASNSQLTLTYAFNYGGRAELVDAYRRMLTAGVTGPLVTEDTVSRHLEYPDAPDPDLIIRTSGEHRLSNFMLWQAAYSEFVFLDVLWPDFRGTNLTEALDIYRARNRRFGVIADSDQSGSSVEGIA